MIMRNKHVADSMSNWLFNVIGENMVSPTYNVHTYINVFKIGSLFSSVLGKKIINYGICR